MAHTITTITGIILIIGQLYAANTAWKIGKKLHSSNTWRIIAFAFGLTALERFVGFLTYTEMLNEHRDTFLFLHTTFYPILITALLVSGLHLFYLQVKNYKDND